MQSSKEFTDTWYWQRCFLICREIYKNWQFLLDIKVLWQCWVSCHHNPRRNRTFKTMRYDFYDVISKWKIKKFYHSDRFGPADYGYRGFVGEHGVLPGLPIRLFSFRQLRDNSGMEDFIFEEWYNGIFISLPPGLQTENPKICCLAAYKQRSTLTCLLCREAATESPLFKF